MMGYFGGGYGGGMMGGVGLLWLATWIAALVFLTLGSIYFWKQINRLGKK